MVQDSTIYYIWIGGPCDYGHKERAGGAAVVIEHDGSIISRDVISDLHTTEFRMMRRTWSRSAHYQSCCGRREQDREDHPRMAVFPSLL